MTGVPFKTKASTWLCTFQYVIADVPEGATRWKSRTLSGEITI